MTAIKMTVLRMGTSCLSTLYNYHFSMTARLVLKFISMTSKKFFNAVSNGQVDILEGFFSLLKELTVPYCVIGGLAVNAYAEPVVSLDLDLVVISEDIHKVRKSVLAKGFKVQDFEHSINLSMKGSDLRIQLQTDPRYQTYLARSIKKKVLGYDMKVASLEDVFQGKIWAYSDLTRRKSKRQKDLADIYRLLETHPRLKTKIPKGLLPE